MRRFYKTLFFLFVITAAWQIIRSFYLPEEKQVRSELRQHVQKSFPELSSQSNSRFGIKRLHIGNSFQHIVLIHGLDDPDKVWMNLAPELKKHGYHTWKMLYPNDQPIRESAKLFLIHLAQLKKQGVSNIVIVAHSMGGLVSREVLTNHRLCLTDCENTELPVVDKLIMVGTPNAGSHLARFRGLGEIREQLARLIDGKSGWLDWILDGAGEAGIDLIPGSPFLMELNSHAPPKDTSYLIIAGVIGAESKSALLNKLDNLIKEKDFSEALKESINELNHDLGDGLVSLESAQLDNIELIKVDGNHLSIIRNISTESRRVPPAIPIILERLEQTK